nr:hypothetical protein [Candidatus Methanodesulfokores washburnensis]
MPERIDGILLLKFFIQLLRSTAINIRIVLAMIMATIIHIIGISKNGKLIPTAPSSILDRHPMADNAQKDEIFSNLGCSSSRASLITHIPTSVKTTKTIQALKEATHLYIASPISQPNNGSKAVDMENAAAILPVLTINFLKFLLGISRLREKARPKSSRDNPNDSKARAR